MGQVKLEKPEDPQVFCSHTEMRDPASLVEHPRNYNTHPAEQIRLLAKIIRHQGWRNPITVSKRSGYVVKGHGRLAAALQLGCSEVPVDVQEYKDEASEYADMIADNRIAELAEADQDALKGLLTDDVFEGFDLDLTGFGDLDFLNDEIDNTDLNDDSENAEDLIDQGDILQQKWGTKQGQIWELGQHRLMCGDSMSQENVMDLMNGEKAGLLFTSPPYGQQRDYTEEGKEKCSDWDALMDGVFSAIQMEDDAQILVNLGLIHRECEWVPYWNNWLDFMRGIGWRRFGLYVWDQGFGLPGDWNGRFAPSFELIFHFNKKSKKPEMFVPKKEENIKERNKGDSTMRGKDGICKEFTSPESSSSENKIPDSVVRINRMHGGHGINHPAIFSVELPMFIAQAWGGLVYEPFCGSGTTLIACEQLNRKCYAMEISPKYIAVILQRWHDMTNQDPVLIETIDS